MGRDEADDARHRLDVDAVQAAIQAGRPVAQMPHRAPTSSTSASTSHRRSPARPDAIADVTYRWPFQIANLNIGVLFILAVLSLAVYGVVIGGWASNNKYSFLGGLRATANMISYEIPLGLSVLAIVVMFGTLDLDEIVDKQAHYWARLHPGVERLHPAAGVPACSSSASTPRPTAPRSTWPKPSRSWSAAITPNTARCASPCSSWPNTRG